MSMQCLICLSDNRNHTAACFACGFPFSSRQSTYHLPSSTLLRQKHYKITDIIGEGGFGITYRGTDLINSREVAIKENWPEKATRQGTTVMWPYSITPKSRQEQIRKFATEAQFLSRCVHFNVVGVYDWFEENNTAYMVMSFIKGKPLSKILEEEGPLPPNRVKRYFLQIADALRTIHSLNLLHRDIKPANIIIDQQDRAILIDFGATKEFVAGQTRTDSVTLTPGYAPIEQYSYRGKRWPATDLYALCASMYELLTGELPAPATERFASETLIPPRQLAPHIDPLIEQVILTGMKMRVEERFQTADELIKALTGGNQAVRLISMHANSPITEFLLEDKKTIIGRFDPNTGVVNVDLENFPNSGTVSRRHAEIFREGGQWKIKDLASLNGVFIKRSGQTHLGAIITRPEILNFGDEIAFGEVHFRFHNF